MLSLEKRALYSLVQDEFTYKNWMMIKKFQADVKTEVIERCLKELVYLCTIPRQIMCADEKYIRNCLEMIHISAGNISLHTTSSMKCGESVDSSLSGHWIIGSINGSKSMRNILKHPMLSRVGVLEDDSELVFPNSCNNSVICLPEKLNKFGSASSIDVLKEPVLDSGAGILHGMLQCTLTDGKPHYVFSLDEKREVYEASLLSTESCTHKGTQWMYSFNLRNRRWKEDHVGTMKVSTHFTTCSRNSKLLETEFILYGLDDKTKDESLSDPLSHSLRTKKGLRKKVASTFKPSLSIRKRTKSVFWRTSSVTDSCPWSPSPPLKEGHNFFEKPIQPYSEIASIIIRKHVNIPPKESAFAEHGGWGASILKRVNQKEVFNTKSHQHCKSEFCSTTDIIIPAGYHTQPETRDGIPTSLIERWKSGGQCDCGGWDIGCPLTVFTTRPNKNTSFVTSSNQKECCSFDTVLKGKERHLPEMKMLNISTDLYCLDFRSSLSAMQCFAIAVADLHCRNSKMQSETVQKLETRSKDV